MTLSGYYTENAGYSAYVLRRTMAMTEAMPLVKIAPNNPVFDLPVLVGIQEGLFKKNGLNVQMSAPYEAREKDSAERPIMTRLKENLFDCGSADSYNVCEWASIDRLERGTRAGNIAALRAAVAAQAILTFDELLQVPGDLADVPVVVQLLTGSHYCTLQMLESAIGPEHVNIEAGGLPQSRWAALESGSIRVATLMEPFISLALKRGAHVIAACFYRGGEVISASLTPEQRQAYYDAENQAVDRINADFFKYAHHITAHAKGALDPHELLRAFVRYKHVDYYDPVLFTRTYDWMKARGLAEGGSDHATLIVR
jgi:NitT/TauT family transport system substrate-binding protein